MAQKTTVILTDDLTGEEADETVRFGFDGKSYSANELRELMAPYVGAARREGSLPSQRRGGSNLYDRDWDPASVRAWAQSNGYDISTRGRVSHEIVAAYKAAGN
jgi:hypothetical protein